MAIVVAALAAVLAGVGGAGAGQMMTVPVMRAEQPSREVASSTVPAIQACFSPRLPGGCDPTATIVGAIDGAQRSVLVQAYSFTSRPIARALIDAHRRGVEVRIIFDGRQFRKDRNDTRMVEAMAGAGLSELIENPPRRGLAHNKVMIIDGETVISGSFNFTTSAEHYNAENLLVIRDPALAAEYTRNWDYHESRSAPLPFN